MGSWNLFNNILGWQGFEIEIGRGSIYNSVWGNSQVVELDGNHNFIITQYFNFDAWFYFKGNDAPEGCGNDLDGVLHYKLKLDWSARTKGTSSLLTSAGNVVWNNKVVGSLIPTCDNIQHSTFDIVLLPGENTLHIDGTSDSDSFGLVVDNVKVFSILNNTNLIHNGGFEQPNLAPNDWDYIDNGFAGWKVK